MSAYLKMIPLALTVATLASCTDEPEQNEPGKTAVSNKILEGSIRDDMLPYDTVQSKPPLADPESSTDNTAKGSEQAARGEDAGAAEATGEEAADSADTEEDAAGLPSDSQPEQ